MQARDILLLKSQNGNTISLKSFEMPIFQKIDYISEIHCVMQRIFYSRASWDISAQDLVKPKVTLTFVSTRHKCPLQYFTHIPNEKSSAERS